MYRTDARTCDHAFGEKKGDSPLSDDLIYCVVAIHYRGASKGRIAFVLLFRVQNRDMRAWLDNHDGCDKILQV